MQQIYGVEVSPALISQVTEEVREEVKAWQSRPLEPVYPIVYLDARSTSKCGMKGEWRSTSSRSSGATAYGRRGRQPPESRLRRNGDDDRQIGTDHSPARDSVPEPLGFSALGQNACPTLKALERRTRLRRDDDLSADSRAGMATAGFAKPPQTSTQKLGNRFTQNC